MALVRSMNEESLINITMFTQFCYYAKILTEKMSRNYFVYIYEEKTIIFIFLFSPFFALCCRNLATPTTNPLSPSINVGAFPV